MEKKVKNDKKTTHSSSILKRNEVRRRNTLALLRVLLEKAPLSRIELAQKSGCDNTTVTRCIRDLLKRKLIATAGKLDVGHGRPREQLIINPDGLYLLGLSLEPTGVCGQLTDFQGNPRVQERIQFQGGRTLTAYLDALEKMTKSLLGSADGHLAGVGVSTFGTSLDPLGAVLHHTANFPELTDFDLRKFFLEKFHILPYFADMMLCNMNDELNRHPVERQGVTMLVHFGQGIGMSLALNGQICFQRNQHGGELGHNICNPDGELCRCGRRGCLETYCSIDHFLAHVKTAKKTEKGLSMSEAAILLQKGDKECRHVVAELQQYMAIALANQINNISPDYLILSGQLLELGDTFCNELEATIRKLLFEYTSRALTVIFRKEGTENRSAIGAALLVRSHLLDTPEFFDKLCPLE